MKDFGLKFENTFLNGGIGAIISCCHWTKHKDRKRRMHLGTITEKNVQ